MRGEDQLSVVKVSGVGLTVTPSGMSGIPETSTTTFISGFVSSTTEYVWLDLWTI